VTETDLIALRRRLDELARELGFAALGVAGIELADDERQLQEWLAAGMHGEMNYMSRHGSKRSHPEELLPGTLRVISVRMDYWPQDAAPANEVLADGAKGYVSRYALGRDSTRHCGRACRNSPTVSLRTSARSATEFLSIVHQCSKNRWHATQV
jgi:epoxyqueuosine reductase QueG